MINQNSRNRKRQTQLLLWYSILTEVKIIICGNLLFLLWAVTTSATNTTTDTICPCHQKRRDGQEKVHNEETSLPITTTHRIHSGWKVCQPPIKWLHRHYNDYDRQTYASKVSCDSFSTLERVLLDNATMPSQSLLHNISSDSYVDNSWKIESLPTTALLALLQRQNMTGINKTKSLTSGELYFSNTLETIMPDISIVGRDYYTLLYEYDLSQMCNLPIFNYFDCMETQQNCSSIKRRRNRSKVNNHISFGRRIIRFAGINYRATAFLDGYPIPELSSLTFMRNSTGSIDGAFHRRSYDITNGLHTFSILVEPPLHPGTCNLNTTTKTTENNAKIITNANDNPPAATQAASTKCMGQGGDHQLAQDGAVSQYMAGWDWCQSIPDRSTGFLGSIVLETKPTQFSIHFPTLRTRNITNCKWISTYSPASSRNSSDKRSSDGQYDRLVCNEIHMSAMVRIECVDTTSEEASLTGNGCTKQLLNMTLRITPDWASNIGQTEYLSKSDATISWDIPFVWNMTTTKCDKSISKTIHGHESNTTICRMTMDIEHDFIIQSDQQGSDMVHLWWPHSVLVDDEEIAFLHTFKFSLISNLMDESEVEEKTYINYNRYVSANAYELYYDEKDDVDGTMVDDSMLHNDYHVMNLIDENFIKIGIRTIETFVDTVVDGQVFYINGCKIFFVGGNWIGTDQTYSTTADRNRYMNELMLHRTAGINLIRIWGGGIAETDDFYLLCDQLGLLVYQEFWMTGDNNGRWAGNLSWPNDDFSYLHNVQDTILRLRSHPSLLFYGGCNECLNAPPSSQSALNHTDTNNPRTAIDVGIRTAINKFDPGRFYVSSSMGGPNIADQYSYNASDKSSIYDNRSYSLSYADGPYGLLLPNQFFQQNPGLQPLAYDDRKKPIKIGFQPEIGSTSAPTYEGLLRFMTFDEVNTGFPKRNSDVVGPTWDFHRYQSWLTALPNTSNTTESRTLLYDHVYAYFPANYNVNASEWAAAAQLANHVQCQHLFNGFISHLFEYTATVIYWKSQSPWPSLRGFLYDWFLESTGGHRGVKSSLSYPVSVVFDPLEFELRLVNRMVLPLNVSCQHDSKTKYEHCANGPLDNVLIDYIGAIYTWYSIDGNAVASSSMYLPRSRSAYVSSMSSVILIHEGSNETLLTWPVHCTEVCLLRVQPIFPCGMKSLQPISWYWLTNPANGYASDYSLMGEMRRRQGATASLSIEGCYLQNQPVFQFSVRLSINVTSNSPEFLFYPTFSITYHMNSTSNETRHEPILPLWDDRDFDVVILPGDAQLRMLQSTVVIQEGSMVEIIMSSWNALTIRRTVFCTMKM